VTHRSKKLNQWREKRACHLGDAHAMPKWQALSIAVKRLKRGTNEAAGTAVF